MYRILVNALSVTNQSGMHVLLGHLNQLTSRLDGTCRFVILHRHSMAEFRRRLGDRAEWLVCPEGTRHWLCRFGWEKIIMPRVAARLGVQAYFTPSGISADGLTIPQVVFCQNPWALVPQARRSNDFIKAWLQRCAYRKTMRDAAIMVFNSHYMQEVYRRNAGISEQHGLVVYQAADDETHARAVKPGAVPRKPGQIACVSVMGPHKNVESVVQALHLLHGRGHKEVQLRLVGSWPDSAYEQKIRSLINTLHLSTAVHFEGFIPRDALDRCYAESMIFCLMSRCESFGIPAIEAQLFGTPVVSSNICAIPEICGAGGVYCDPDDVTAVADAMQRLLEDDIEWNRLSGAARLNADKYRWETCSTPLVNLFRDLARG